MLLLLRCVLKLVLLIIFFYSRFNKEARARAGGPFCF